MTAAAPSGPAGEDVVAFLGLEATTDPARWLLPVGEGIRSSSSTLFGGCLLAAAIAALETCTGRPCVWATAHFLRFAQVGATVELGCEALVTGNTVTQAAVSASVGGRPIAHVAAALGARSFELEGRWCAPPAVPPPDAAPRRTITPQLQGAVHERVDLRLADGRQFSDLDGTPGTGRSAMWARLPGGPAPTAAGLAVLGDFVAHGVAQALGVPAGGNSLDNTLRIVRLVPSTWVLLDTHVDAVLDGFANGTIRLWSEDGTLLALASQTIMARRREL